MQKRKCGSQPFGKGDSQYFTGQVHIEPLFEPISNRLLASNVLFEPGARTLWHTHLLGQTLVVTSGCGLVQSWGGPIEEIRTGDVIWCPPGEKHWHGAGPATPMTHTAFVELVDGKSTEWMERVSDEEYLANPTIRLSPDEARPIEELSLPHSVRVHAG